jgi:hypothetical protein
MATHSIIIQDHKIISCNKRIYAIIILQDAKQEYVPASSESFQKIKE